MKASELRIGNLFKYSDNAIIKPEKRGVISSIIADDISFLAHSDNENLIEPIPLTEEWLLKFGFEYEDLGDDSPYEWYKKDNIEIWDFNSGYWICDMLNQYGFEKEIKYIHQLQNLYFALTGEELTLKS